MSFPAAHVLLLLLGRLQIAGASACPTREALEQQLRETLGATFEATDQVLNVEVNGQSLRLRLTDREGSVLGDKTLALSEGSCASLAAESALLVSMWEAALPAPVLEAPAAPPAPPKPKAAVAAPAPAPLPRPSVWELGGAVTGSYAKGSRTSNLGIPGLTLFASFGKGHLWGRLWVSADLPETLSAAPVTWDRPTLGLSGIVRFEPRAGSVEIEATVLGAILVVTGSSYSSVNLGLSARVGARFYLLHTRLRPWVEVSVPCWPDVDTLKIQGATVAFPLVLVTGALGAAYTFE
jgi:hypothetical protein